MVVQGNENTLGVTIDQMVYHTRCVSRGASRSFIVADMPFLSYQVSPEEALRNAGRLISEAAHGVKLEGGLEVRPTVSRMVAAGIPVMGHIGLTPQHVHQLGGFKAQGKDTESATALIEAAKALEEAGAFSWFSSVCPANSPVKYPVLSESRQLDWSGRPLRWAGPSLLRLPGNE